MIPNSEERYIRAEYEYHRRRFLLQKKGQVRAWFLLAFAVLINLGCIVLNRRYHIFSFTLVCRKNSCFLLT